MEHLDPGHSEIGFWLHRNLDVFLQFRVRASGEIKVSSVTSFLLGLIESPASARCQGALICLASIVVKGTSWHNLRSFYLKYSYVPPCP